MLTAQFVQYTFQPWFKEMSTTNINKRLKNTNAKYRIPIDVNNLCDKSDDIRMVRFVQMTIKNPLFVPTNLRLLIFNIY